MPNMQYYNAAYPRMDWSGEISAPQPSAQAHTTTSTTTTTTSSASAGHSGSMAAPSVTTTTNTNTSAGAAAPEAAGQAPDMRQAPGMNPVPGMTQAPGTSPSPGMSQGPAQSAYPPAVQAPAPSRNEFEGSSATLDLQTHQPIEVIEAPASMNEAFLGSMKSMLLRNRGSFVTATFLIGTQGTTTWEGILHDVGNDHIIIFQPGRQRYIACDIYALKYIEFYDTRERDACAQLLQQSGLNSDMNRGRNSFY